jgi:hypothetical protein
VVVDPVYDPELVPTTYSARSEVPFTDEPAFWNPELPYTFIMFVLVSNHRSPAVGLPGAVAEIK